MNRREFIALLGGALAAWPLAARAQQSRKVPRIGVLLPGTAASFALRTKAFLEGLRELGYIDGQTVAIEWKWGQDRVEGLSELAAELVGRNVDVLLTGGTAAAKALKSATGTIPIVMAIIGDPVAAGLVESLARPGGNATGFSIVAPDLSGKTTRAAQRNRPRHIASGGDAQSRKSAVPIRIERNAGCGAGVGAAPSRRPSLASGFIGGSIRNNDQGLRSRPNRSDGSHIF